MKTKVKHHNAAGLVPYSKEGGELKFLLIKNSLGWEFPKGIVEEGESKLAAAKREAQEETGLEINSINPSFKYASKYFIRKNYETGEKLETPEPKTVTYYLGEVPTQNVKLSSEHDTYGWFTPAEANKKLFFSSKKEVLHMALNYTK